MQSTAAPIRPIKKVCVIGPECTGKSDLSQFLAGHYKTVCVEEYARAYINRLGRPYEQSDLTKIAHGQVRMEDEWLVDTNKVMICDTNVIVIKVWSEFKYNECDKEILKIIDERAYDLYLLTYIDVPWENDPQREHPDKREQFWTIFKKEVEQTNVPFVEINGVKEERRQKAIAAIDTLLAS
jgi:NadR type nicotinamide-nucleotide adenylyltransferase